MSKSLLLVEFNALCPHQVERWTDAGHLPNFRRLRDESHVFVSRADAEEAAYLAPWIQWYSLHTGLSFDEHGVLDRGDALERPFEDIGSLLRAAGRSTACAGSPVVRPVDDARGFFLAGPGFSGPGAPPADPVRLRALMATRGLRLRTAAALLADMTWRSVRDAATRGAAGPGAAVSGPASQGAHAAVADRLRFEVFRHHYLRRRPDFASFFADGAAFMHDLCADDAGTLHGYARADADRRRRRTGVVFNGYRHMDRLLGELMRVAGSDTVLMLASGLSMPWPAHPEGARSNQGYRPRDLGRLLAVADLAPLAAQPAASHGFTLRFAHDAQRDHAAWRLAGLSVEGRPAFDVDIPGDTGVVRVGNALWHTVPADARVADAADETTHRFGDLFTPLEAGDGGWLHPDGLLWMRTGPGARIHEGRVSILDVLPTILDIAGVREPPYLQGRSLRPRLQPRVSVPA